MVAIFVLKTLFDRFLSKNENGLYDIEKNAGSRLPAFTKMILEERWLGMVIRHVVDGNRKVILHLFGGSGFKNIQSMPLRSHFMSFSRRLAVGWQPAHT